VPPGYKDKAKPGYYAVGDRELIRKFSDLVLWKEIIQQKQTKSLPLCLSPEISKKIGGSEKRGKKLGPRKSY
jgi:hypothetical protein